jgi:hypothetical protein
LECGISLPHSKGFASDNYYSALGGTPVILKLLFLKRAVHAPAMLRAGGNPLMLREDGYHTPEVLCAPFSHPIEVSMK